MQAGSKSGAAANRWGAARTAEALPDRRTRAEPFHQPAPEIGRGWALQRLKDSTAWKLEIRPAAGAAAAQAPASAAATP